jgi:hypothetical protein
LTNSGHLLANLPLSSDSDEVQTLLAVVLSGFPPRRGYGL